MPAKPTLASVALKLLFIILSVMYVSELAVQKIIISSSYSRPYYVIFRIPHFKKGAYSAKNNSPLCVVLKVKCRKASNKIKNQGRYALLIFSIN